jgi:hypothetical protein
MTVLRLLVETDGGMFVHEILPARTLPDSVEVGPGAEEATRSAAAAFGLPDFVFRPTVRAKGSRSRELGDAIVTVGEFAAVVQVKARKVASSDGKRERSWLDKAINTATRQALGTIRSMKTAPVVLVNERGRQLTVDGRVKRWVPVVVIDHPATPATYEPALEGSAKPVVLLRSDWEFLFDQLKSTDAVIRYLHRVSENASVPLGHESVRYYRLAAADAAADPGPVDPRFDRPGMKSAPTPLLPQTPAGSDDEPAHTFLRFILEDVAMSPRPQDVDESQRLEVLAAIDTLAIGYRSELGRTLISWLGKSEFDPPGEVLWRVRRLQFPDRPYLIFAVASRWTEAVKHGFNTLITLRHQQQVELLGPAVLTAGILLTRRHDGKRPWDTTLAAARGHVELDHDYRAELEHLWPETPAPV